MPLLSEEHSLYVITYKAAYQRCKAYLDAYFTLDDISREAAAFRNGKGPYTAMTAQQLCNQHRRIVLNTIDRLEGVTEGVSLDLLHEFETLTKDLKIYQEEGITAIRLHKSVLHTAFELLRLYLAEYENAKKLKLTTYYNNLPYLHTRQSSLASLTRCHRNTMRDHIDRLKQIGFVEQYRERYSGGLEILVNWDVVFGKEIAAWVRQCFGKSFEETKELFTIRCEQLENNSSKKDTKNPFFKGVAQKFTPLSSETSIQNNSKVIKTVEGVDNVNKSATTVPHAQNQKITNDSLNPIAGFGNDFFGNEEKEALETKVPNRQGENFKPASNQSTSQTTEQEHPLSTLRKKLALSLHGKTYTPKQNRQKLTTTPQQQSQQQAASVEQKPVITTKPTKTIQYGYNEREHAYYLKFATYFWKSARKKLYPYHFFTLDQEVDMIHKVAETVFQNFQNDQNWQHEDWTRYYKHCIAALDFQHLALINYGAYVTHPASYFSLKNTRNGWKQNVQRFEDYKQKAKYYALKSELKKIELEAEEYRNREGKYLDKSPQQLFQIHKRRLLKQKSPELLQAFYELVAQKNIYTQRSFDLKI
ncbi:hypothetical protein GCM10023331_26230 [Algivirga pacifica]|uniref:Uncharacterized protein n=2 Tax=Algivirga pacifica TaxID=1162670 RepID=A0ABP9DJH7_9BACT